MRLTTLLTPFLLPITTTFAFPFGEMLGPVVDPAWLSSHLTAPNVVVLDLRAAAEYEAGHIPGSRSVPFEPVSDWSIIGDNNLLLEMPPTSSLYPVLESHGISNPWPMTKVILVYGVGSPAFPQAAAPRVATTLKYCGISVGRVAVLDGGYPGWAGAGHQTATGPAGGGAGAGGGHFYGWKDEGFLVDIDYVHDRLDDESVIMFDGRDAAVYNGSVVEEWAQKPGHIPGAYSLPAVNIWNGDGSYKDPEDLLALVHAAAGGTVSRWQGEIIVYCGVGGYASSWYFVLTRILGFNNVKMYDGSAQEWSLYYDMEV